MAILLPVVARPRVALPRIFPASRGLISRQAKLTFKNAGGRAFHHNRGPFTLPFNDQAPALELNIHPIVQQATQTTRDDCRTSATATGHGFTRTTLEHPQPGMGAINNLQKPDIGPRREAGMVLQPGAKLPTGAVSTSSTTSTPWGLPMDTALSSTVSPPTSTV